EAIQEGKKPRKTLAVSTLLGATEFKGDPKEYEAYKYYGTFIHDVLEKLQLLSINRGKSSSELFTDEFFDIVYEEFTKSSSFVIENLSTDTMKSQVKEIIKHIAVKTDEGYIVLPELTLVGQTNHGTPVIGRLDIVLVGLDGS